MGSFTLDRFSDALKEVALDELENGNPVPARHRTRDEYEAALRYALAMGWGQPMANHAGRWFTFVNVSTMCTITYLGGDKQHHCKDMDP